MSDLLSRKIFYENTLFLYHASVETSSNCHGIMWRYLSDSVLVKLLEKGRQSTQISKIYLALNKYFSFGKLHLK